MTLNIYMEVSNKAPALPIELTQDLMDAFEIIPNVFGGSALGHASMKTMQCLPLAWACLAVKEAGKKAEDVRDREALRCYQEVALLGFIRLCHEAIEEFDGALWFPRVWDTNLYYTTLGGFQEHTRPGAQDVHAEPRNGVGEVQGYQEGVHGGAFDLARHERSAGCGVGFW